VSEDTAHEGELVSVQTVVSIMESPSTEKKRKKYYLTRYEAV
jgi:hypothetical protein